MNDTLIEAIARAIYESQWVGEYPTSGIEHAMAVQNAQAALTAITEAGYAVVPREPELLPAGWEQRALPAVFEGGCSEIYRAMISAAQGDGG